MSQTLAGHVGEPTVVHVGERTVVHGHGPIVERIGGPMMETCTHDAGPLFEPRCPAARRRR
ncbi:MAG TPA: hypothetical protein VGP27_06390, partial [Mycobacterium sp.]|nr:hypothetical protein [Mycobacterium sp.]